MLNLYCNIDFQILGENILPKECTNQAGRIMPFLKFWEEFTSAEEIERNGKMEKKRILNKEKWGDENS